MMKRVCFLFLFLLSCSDDILMRTCPGDCFSGPEGTEGVGECKSGIPLCDEDFNIVLCEGEKLPSMELCDGRDNDCDGLSDGYIYPVHPYDFWAGRYGLEEYPCFSLGECAGSVLGCIDSDWICSYWGTEAELDENNNVVENETRCDGRDNDCD